MKQVWDETWNMHETGGQKEDLSGLPLETGAPFSRSKAPKAIHARTPTECRPQWWLEPQTRLVLVVSAARGFGFFARSILFSGPPEQGDPIIHM